MSMPLRASDAGPDRPERPTTWIDELDSAADEISTARRIYREDPREAKRLRLVAVDEAMLYLVAARKLLEVN